MVVWGGSFYHDPVITFLNTGGRYDPSTDSWVATSTTNAPSARASHTAVWTGSEMIVWGGFDGFNGFVVNTGGRYDPSTDTWSGHEHHQRTCWAMGAHGSVEWQRNDRLGRK